MILYQNSLVPNFFHLLLILIGDGEAPGQMMESAEDGIDYSTAPSSLPVVNADGSGGKVDGAGEPEVTLYQSQSSAGINEQGLPPTEVNNVGGVADGWERTFEGNKTIVSSISQTKLVLGN